MADSDPDARVLAAALSASQSLDLARFIEICVEGIGELIAADSVHGYLRSSEGQDLELRTSWTRPGRPVHRPPARLDGRLIREAGDAGRLTEAQRLRPGGAPWPEADSGEILLLPVGRGRNVAGVYLVLAGVEGGPFTHAAIGKARAFLSSVAPAHDNIVLVGELRETALRDDLAACYNRRHFESFLGEEVARARRFRSHVSLVFLDMDNLKEVNSAHGHAMGSRTLQEVSLRIGGGIRKIDKLFRFGGDEFCIVLPETDSEGALLVASRIREQIDEAPFLVQEVGGVRLTASLGVSTFPESGSTGEALVLAADRAMQEIKQSGKNGLALAQPVPEGASGHESRRSHRVARESG